MRPTYGMDTCIETNEIIAFGMEVYSACNVSTLDFKTEFGLRKPPIIYNII
jgi:hypothetical protein